MEDKAMSDISSSKTNIYHNFYECPCGETWEDHWSCACNDKCPGCNKEIEPYKSEVEPYVIELPCHGIRVELSEVDPYDWENFIGGTIQSELGGGKLETDAQEAAFKIIGETQVVNEAIEEIKENIFKAATDILEAMILACACAKIDIKSPAFIEAIETVADKISNEYGD
jgi:hypothetical protein